MVMSLTSVWSSLYARVIGFNSSDQEMWHNGYSNPIKCWLCNQHLTALDYLSLGSNNKGSCDMLWVGAACTTFKMASAGSFISISLIESMWVTPTTPKVMWYYIGLYFLFQVALITVSMILWPPQAELSMPVRTEKYVERHCNLEALAVFTPLAFNIFLVLLCSIFAFLARKLPDNFNECWYIFLTLATTLFIWMAFLPTYYSAFYAYHKAAFLALALILIGAATLVVLFGPKLYALFFVAEDDIKITDFEGSHSSSKSNIKKAK